MPPGQGDPPIPQAHDAPGFVRLRWRGQARLRTLFWRDMLVYGTTLNLLLSFAALMSAALGLPAAWAVAVHFAPTPWNAFLVAALWRTPGASPLLRVAALIWLGLMLVL